MKKTIISIVAATVIGCGCITTSDPKADYAKYQNYYPEFSIIQTDDAALNEIQKSVKNINSMVKNQLNSYYNATSANNLYNEVIAEAQKIKQQNRNMTLSQALLQAENAIIAYHNLSSGDVDKAVNQGLKTIDRLNPASKIRELTAIVNELNNIKLNVGKVKNSFNFKDPTSLTKIRATTSITEQILYGIDAAQFLISQYQTAIQLK
ncbi:MAG: hypothetical protein IKD09_03540 [Lentisphaeria bacterium]|nr:hypothetical protein [Lentisphaeria bacterium]